MKKQDFADWTKHPQTLEVFELLRARRKELIEAIVVTDISEQELFRIRGIVHCMDALMSGDIIEEEE